MISPIWSSSILTHSIPVFRLEDLAANNLSSDKTRFCWGSIGGEILYIFILLRAQASMDNGKNIPRCPSTIFDHLWPIFVWWSWYPLQTNSHCFCRDVYTDVLSVQSLDSAAGIDDYGDQRENVSIRARCSIDCRTYNGPQPRSQVVNSQESTRPGELTKSYWKWPFIVDFPIKNGDFPLLC